MSVEFLRDRDLQVMAGNAFVIRDVFNRVEIAVGGVVGVDEQTAGAAAVGRAVLVVSGRRSLLHDNREPATTSNGALGRRPKSCGSFACIGVR